MQQQIYNPSLNRAIKTKKVKSAKTKQSVIGKDYKLSGNISINKNNDSRDEYQSSSSSEEEDEQQKVPRPSNGRNDMPPSYMNALVIGAGENQNNYTPVNEDFNLEF